MADATQAEILAAAAEQKATDPRLEQQAPVAQPEPAPIPAPAAAAAAAAPDSDAAPAAPETPAPELAPKPRKSPVEALTGRVGHLTKVIGDKDRALAETQAQLEAAQRLLAARGTTPAPDGEVPPAAPPAPANINPATGLIFTQAEFEKAVADTAAVREHNRQADALYDAGATKYPDWRENVDMLNATGLMTRDLLDAAMATDDGAAVIHYLGADVEEAQRIAALSPIRMAAELTKIGARLAAPGTVPAPRVSSAPAPVPAVRGSVNPTIDLGRVSENDDMSAYAAARRQQGAWHAQPRAGRVVR